MIIQSVNVKRLRGMEEPIGPSADVQVSDAVLIESDGSKNADDYNHEPSALASWRGPQDNGMNFDSEQFARLNYQTADIVVIENRSFMRGCIARSLKTAFSGNIQTFPDVAAFIASARRSPSTLIFLSVPNWVDEVEAKTLFALAEWAPDAPVVVLSLKDDLDAARAALGYGARGYVTMSMGFDIVIEAVRFVMAGGTYVPAQCVLARGAPSQPAMASVATDRGMVTERELAVMRAIRQGKPNKIIAYELNMCESTVKVHVRHIMKKLSARNRTEVAIKSATFL